MMRDSIDPGPVGVREAPRQQGQPRAGGRAEHLLGQYDESMCDGAASTRKSLSGPTGQRVAAHRDQVREVLRRHGVTDPEIFGSAARGDDHEGSDVDILIDVPPGTSIIDIIGIQHELEDLLGVHVDLVPRRGLRERVRVRAAKDLIAL